MSIEDLEIHPIYKNIESLNQQTVNLYEDNDFIETVENLKAVKTLSRINSVKELLKSRLDSIDPLLIQESTLDVLDEEVCKVLRKLKKYKQTFSDNASLNNLNNNMEKIIEQINYIPLVVQERSLEGIKSSVVSFRKSLGQQRSHFKKEQKELHKFTKDLKKEFTHFQKDMEDLSNQAKEEMKNLQEQQKEEQTKNEKLREKHTEQLDEIKLNNKSDYEYFMSQKEKDFQSMIDQYSDTLNHQRKKFEKEYSGFLYETRRQQEKYDKELNEHKKSVEELVGAISTNSISGYFKTLSDKYNKLTILWQIVTVFSFLITIIFGGYFFIIEGQNLEWTNLIAKALVASALGSFTAYSSHQAAKNEKKEEENRQMEVELKTLNPYIASFNYDEQKKLKEQLFPSIFGQAKNINSNTFDISDNQKNNE